MARSGDRLERRRGVEAIAEAQARMPSRGRGRAAVGLRVLTVLATPLNYLDPRGRSASGPMRLAELRRRDRPAGADDAARAPRQPGRDRRCRETADRPDALRGRERADADGAGDARRRPAPSRPGWAQAPGGPASLAGGSAKGIVKAFVDGWGSTMMRSFGRGPMSLTELDRGIADLSYPALERRLVEHADGGAGPRPARRDGVGTPYAVTDVGPARGRAAGRGRALRAASTCAGEAAPITRDDIEAAFLLALPLVDLAGRDQRRLPARGRRRSGATAASAAGVRVIGRGRPGRRLRADRGEPTPEDFATGSAETWLEAVSGAARPERLRLGGEVAAERGQRPALGAGGFLAARPNSAAATRLRSARAVSSPTKGTSISKVSSGSRPGSSAVRLLTIAS